MKKIFFVAGELSGDIAGGWYVRKVLQNQGHELEGIGGDHLAHAGVKIYERFENLNVVGVVEIVQHIPRLLTLMRKLVAHIINNDFNHVVLIDFPGFNLLLAKRLKRAKPNIKITYFCPPQLWCWGQWRLKTIKVFCDNVVVLYPFEVDWYKKRGVNAEWFGCPVYDRLQPYIAQLTPKKPCVALIPGSRHSEVATLFPIALQVAQRLEKLYPELTFVIPAASSVSHDLIVSQVKQFASVGLQAKINIVVDEEEKYHQLAQCCLALTKPGTITLELALLQVPTIMYFKTSWLTYLLAKPIVQVEHMALPNLLLSEPLYKEFVQGDCTIEKITDQAQQLYQSYLRKTAEFGAMMAKYQAIGVLFSRVL